MKKLLYSFIVLAMTLLYACNTYKEYEVEYSAAYPICGAYYVKDYDDKWVATSDYYYLDIFNASIEADKYVWINNMQTSATYNNSYRVKTQYDIARLSFNCSMNSNIPTGAVAPSPVLKYVTIEQSKVEVKEWPTQDSIIFKVTIYNADKVLERTFYSAGVRCNGFEDDYWDKEFGQ